MGVATYHRDSLLWHTDDLSYQDCNYSSLFFLFTANISVGTKKNFFFR